MSPHAPCKDCIVHTIIGLAILCWTLDGQQVVLDDGSANVLGQIAEQASILVCILTLVLT